MPNWTTNYVSISGNEKEVLALKNKLKGKTPFDFEKLIPMPEELNIQESPNRTIAMLHYLIEELGGALRLFTHEQELVKKLGLIPSRASRYLQDYLSHIHEFDSKELHEEGRRFVANKLHYGAYTWYDWRCNNWGTKWNACDVQLTDERDYNNGYKIEYSFDTAWCIPGGIYDYLKENYPRLKFSITYYNEGDNEEYNLEFGGKS